MVRVRRFTVYQSVSAAPPPGSADTVPAVPAVGWVPAVPPRARRRVRLREVPAAVLVAAVRVAVRRGRVRVPIPGDVPGDGARASRVRRRVHARARERGAEQAPREEHARARERPAALSGAAHVRAGRETLGDGRRPATRISRVSRTRSGGDDRLAVGPLERPSADRTSARREHARESTRVSAVAATSSGGGSCSGAVACEAAVRKENKMTTPFVRFLKIRVSGKISPFANRRLVAR